MAYNKFHPSIADNTEPTHAAHFSDIGQPIGHDEEFCKVAIDDFTTGRQIQFDLFIRLSESKYIKIAAAGDCLPMDRIRAYKNKRLCFFHLRKEEFVRYLGFNAEIAKKIKDASYISREKKVDFLKHTGEVILEQFFLNELNDGVFEIAKGAVETMVEVFLDIPDMAILLESLNSHSDSLYAHSVGVAAYSSILARAMEWSSPQNLYKVTMGGLLHDLGKKELDVAILAKHRSKLTLEEAKLLNSHTNRGVGILSEIRSVPGDVLQIIAQHHENCLGTGWPGGLRKSHIHPMARIVSVADEFCYLVMKSQTDPVSVPDALERICVVRKQEFDPAVLGALLSLFRPEVVQQKEFNRALLEHPRMIA